MNIIFKSKKVVIAAVIILLAVVSIISAVIVNSASEGVKVSNKLKLGDRFLTELKYEDAVVAFKEVIEIEPRNIPAYLGIADAYVGLEQPAEAVAWLEKGIDETEKYYDETGELVADSEQLYLKDADILGDMGEYERAIDILERGQEITGDEAIEEKLEEIKSLLTVEATVASGSYDQTQLVELKSAGTRIYYTMDGSEPNQDSMYYEGPILIEFGSTTLKTVAEDEKGELGEVCSFTYEVGNGDLTETETAQNTPDSTPAEDIDIPDEDLLPEDTDLTEVDQNSETPTESPDNTDTAQEVITTDPVNPIATPIPDTNVIVTPKPVVTPTPKPLATPTPKPAATPTPVISKEPVLASESDFSYTVSDNGVSITKYTGKGGNIIIPDTLGGQKVTEIKREAFRKNLALIGITIPASVNAIETQAFYDTNIKTVTFKEGMTQIPAFALQDCESVETIMIPSTVTVIKGGTYAGAFDGCTNLKNIKLPKGLIEIGTNAFKNCSSLTEITIPSTVTKIGQFAFSGCKGLTAITIPASVTDMGGSVFKNTGIKNVTFAEGMSKIPAYALQECESVETIIIPSTVTVIGGGTYAGAFDGCTILKNIKLPKGLIEIGSNVFKNCSSLTEITIPSTVTKIGQYAFTGCKGLTAITIPASVADVGGSVFKNTGIKTVTFAEGMSKIPAYALQECESVETIIIPSTVTVIGGGTYAGAFDGCTNLKNIILPKGLIEIGSNVFKNCSSLTEITIPSTVTKIGQYAFTGCKGLTAITIPASVADMGGSVFKNTGIKTVTFAEGMSKIPAYALQDCNSAVTIMIPSTVTVIGGGTYAGAFDGCTNLKNIKLPKGLLEIGTNAFKNCNSLTEITIPSTVTKIGQHAFGGCTSLQTVTFEGTKPQLGKDAFPSELGIS